MPFNTEVVMKSVYAFGRIGIPIMLGVVVATMTASPAEARRVCDCNICFTSDGNCDVSEWVYNCDETPEGCKTYSCTDTFCIQPQ